MSATPQTTDSAVRKHHKYGPSKLNYVDQCAGYTSSDKTSDASEEGTMLHDIMQKMLLAVVAKKYKTCMEQVKIWLPDNYELTDDQMEYIRECSKQCDVFIAKKPTAIHVEIDVRTHDESGKKELNHGFLDVFFQFGRNGILIDFKFGWIPVKPAHANLQGKNYALGCFQKFLNVDTIGVRFIQPKLNVTSSAIFKRTQMADLYEELSQVITNAEHVQKLAAAKDEKVQQYLKPGKYCTYCALADRCAKLANTRMMVVAKYNDIPMPETFKGLEITDPQQAALARYWAELATTCVDEVKTRAFELAQANGDEISCTLPNGEVITYQVRERGMNRSLGSAVEVAEALKEFMTADQVLGAAELSIGALEKIAKVAYVEYHKQQNDGEKITLKKAWEIICSTLETNSLLSRPDGKIRFLQQVKQGKQIEDKK